MNRWLKQGSKYALLIAMGASTSLTMTAQDASAPADEDEARQNTIVVTARNRAENLQDVPLAITAFDEDALQRRSIQELEDIARFTSGFSFEDFSGGFANPVIRGQAQTRATALEANVSSFWDGIYIPRSWAVDLGTAGVSRIEDVKGPQRARYGRNANAGAINYVPKKATIGDPGLTGDAEVTIGTDERLDFGGYANIAVNDYFAIAGTYNRSEFDGSFTNGHPFADLGISPGTDGNVGGWDNESFSVSGILEPTDALTIEAAYYSSEIQNEARPSRWLAASIGDGNCGELLFGVYPSLLCGAVPEANGVAVVDPRGYGTLADTDIIRLSASYEISDNFTIAYTYGKIEGDVDIGTSGEPDPINCGTLVGPPAFSALCNFQVTPVGDIDYDSHELRLTFDTGGNITGAVGAFISEGEDNNRFTSVNIAPITDPGNFQPFFGNTDPSFDRAGPFNILLGDDTTQTDISSVFGEALWTSGDGITRVGVEGRYSETEITAINNRNMDMFNETFSVFTPRFTVERDLNDDQLIYASIARGAKAGGFNAGATFDEYLTFDEETIWTYEFGAKNYWPDYGFTFNGAVFYIDWSDVQINRADPAAPAPQNAPSIVSNLGNVTVYGFEIDALWQATDNLAFDATLSHSNAKYDDDTIDNRFTRGAQCDDIVCNSNGDVGGNEVERTPPTQFSVGSQWEGNFNADTDYYLRGDVSWQSEFFVSPANVATIPSRALVKLSAGVNYKDFAVSVWGRNVTDEVYVSNSFAVFLPFGNTYGTFYGERATYGVTISTSF